MTSVSRSGLIFLFAACTTPLAPYEPPTQAWVHSDRARLRDETDRVVILRGVNARVEGLFDVTFDDGRTALEEIPAFAAEDALRMRELGMNVLRLPVNWSGIEPERGVYDEAYLAHLEDVVALCADAGVHVIVDFHQDAYSKEIGEDGAPLWAIHPPPEMLLEGPLGDSLEMRILSPQVARAFEGFFVDDDEDTTDQELQAAFAAMARTVAERFADEPWVLGYDLFNEPVIADRYLYPFHDRVARAIREVDDRHLILFEPAATRNISHQAPRAPAPFPDDGGVYAVHLYDFAFTDDDLRDLERGDLERNFRNATIEAASFEVPLFVGEWGIGPTALNMDIYVDLMLDLFDEGMASSAVWLWKERSQGSWGFFALDGEAWIERPEVIAAHARIYAERIAGEPVSMSYERDTRHFELVYEGRADAAPHVIYVPFERFSARCDGTFVESTRDARTGQTEIVCAGNGTHTLVVEGD